MRPDNIQDAAEELVAMRGVALQKISDLEEVAIENMTHLRLAVWEATGSALSAIRSAWSVLDRIGSTAGRMKDVIEKAKQE